MSKRFLTVHDRGNLTLPADLRRQYGLDKPGVQVEVVARDGVIELHPHVAVPANQAWYWTGTWQKGERAVEEHVAAGRVKIAENVDPCRHGQGQAEEEAHRISQVRLDAPV